MAFAGGIGLSLDFDVLPGTFDFDCAHSVKHRDGICSKCIRIGWTRYTSSSVMFQ